MNDLKLGWLSPTGEFHECNAYDHVAVAQELADGLRLHCYDFKRERRISADDALMKAGWVYIGVSSLGMKEYRVGWNRHLTPEQKQFLDPYFDSSNEIPMNKFNMQQWKWEQEFDYPDFSWIDS